MFANLCGMLSERVRSINDSVKITHCQLGTGHYLSPGGAVGGIFFFFGGGGIT